MVRRHYSKGVPPVTTDGERSSSNPKNYRCHHRDGELGSDDKRRHTDAKLFFDVVADERSGIDFAGIIFCPQSIFQSYEWATKPQHL